MISVCLNNPGPYQCFLREAPERAIGGVFAALRLPKSDRRAGKWGLTHSVLVGDPTGPTATGSGSMWVDSFSFDNAAGSIPVVPEPGAVSFLGLATGMLVLRRRRKTSGRSDDNPSFFRIKSN